MTNVNEIGALKASFRGALAAADTLGSLAARVEALDASTDPDESMLDELSRAAAAHAVAASALRGLVKTMLERRRAPGAQ